MFKKEILVSYNYNSNNHGNGVGYFTRKWYGKLNGSDDINILIEDARGCLRDYYKDNQDYFNIVIINIVKLGRL